MYHGNALGILEYLIRLGFRFGSPGENVADWFIDVVTGVIPRFNADGVRFDHARD